MCVCVCVHGCHAESQNAMTKLLLALMYALLDRGRCLERSILQGVSSNELQLISFIELHAQMVDREDIVLVQEGNARVLEDVGQDFVIGRNLHL